MKKAFIFLFLTFLFTCGHAQDSIVQNGYQKFYHSNGVLASEGTMQDGKPNGYWKTYYKNGVLKSEGNRKQFQLDSTWKFYDENGKLKTILTYKKGVYNGPRFTFLEDRIVLDPYQNGKKEGLAKVFYTDSTVWMETPFVNGVENGLAYEYAKDDGRIITRIEYKNGFPFRREMINRKDGLGRKQGDWKTYFEEGQEKTVFQYSSDVKNGYFKWFDEDGNLTKIEKYEMGSLIEDAPEIATFDVRTSYYPDGTVKIIASYKNNMPEGMRREFNEDGSFKAGYVMHKGKIIGKGHIDDEGKKQGEWEEFYLSGKMKSKGSYKNNIRVGKWLFYHENGVLEQSGSFTEDGKYDGLWTWYYDNGLLRREENLIKGVLHGEMVEYYTDTTEMLRGRYYQGIREGMWHRNVHGYREEGEYVEDVRNGIWKYYYPNDQLMFEGNYLDGDEDGKHVWYYKNGEKKMEGNYISGMRDGTWKYYTSEGQLRITIVYSNGIEVQYDNVQVLPEIQNTDLE